LVVALSAGGMFAWLSGMRRDLGRVEQLPKTEAAELHGPELETRENFLRNTVEQDADPGNERLRITRGVTNRIDLGEFYLQEHRLEQADRFFKELEASKVRAYHTLGRIGHAIVLAYENKTAQSNQEFLELIGGKPGFGEHAERMQLLMNQARLRAEIARALEFNKANATRADPFPQRLESWTKAPRWQSKW
jgi:hypothetical protein